MLYFSEYASNLEAEFFRSGSSIRPYTGGSRGGGHGAMAPPKRDMGGAKVSFGPPQKADIIRIFSLCAQNYYMILKFICKFYRN